MNRFFILIAILLLAATMSAQDMNPYANILHSSRCADGNLRVRWNDFTPSPLQTECLYSTGSGWQTVPAEDIGDLWFQALVPYEFGQNLRYRLHSEVSIEGETGVAMHPAYLSSDAFPPTFANLGLIGTDATGDSVMVYGTNLDFTGSWCAATENKIFSAVANVSGSFPTFNSLTSYNAYATTIANPSSVTDTLVYAMLYTFNVAGLINSGLYKMYIDDTGIPAYQRIGDIQSMVMGGRLYLACNIADLTADPEFGEWPNMYDALAIASLSMRLDVNLSTQDVNFGLGDYSTPALLIFKDNRYQVAQNSLPQYSDFEIGAFDPNTLSFNYNDADGDFPLTAEFEFPDGSLVPVVPMSFQFDQQVPFAGYLPYEPESGTLRLSDNGIDFVEYEYSASSAPDTPPLQSGLSCRMPNPFRSGMSDISISLSGLEKGSLTVSVYDIRGRKLGSIHSGSVSGATLELNWDGRINGRDLASGVYILQIRQSVQTLNRRFAVSR